MNLVRDPPCVCGRDDVLLAERGVFIGFTERGGGVSEPPYGSLNLASHVGDDPRCVDENRRLLLDAVGLTMSRERLTMAEQVHGDHVESVDLRNAGAGAFAASGLPPIPATDALLTQTPGLPLMLCFADCVPVILVGPGPTVAVVHAGWRGALAELPGKAATIVAGATGGSTAEVFAYIGPHIAACHYETSCEIMSQFVNSFGTFARAESGGLDLDAVVTASLDRAGVNPCNIARLGSCTAETTDRFFSYRAEGGITGRHSALACILSDASS